MNEANDNAAERRLQERAKALFDDSVERLDAATLSHLNQGRQAALESLHGRQRTAMWGRWLPVTGLAAAVLVTVMVVRGPDGQTLPADSVADFEILLEGENLEMYEDLEFYSWLESADLDSYSNAG